MNPASEPRTSSSADAPSPDAPSPDAPSPDDGASDRSDIVVVHYRSGGMLLDLLGDLAAQRHASLTVHVVECGDDGTVSTALDAYRFETTVPGENVGYCGGNDLVLRTLHGLRHSYLHRQS